MNDVKPWVKYAGKAVYAGVITLIGGLTTALLPDSNEVVEITLPEGLAVAGLVVTAVAGVFGITNGSKP